MSHKSKKIAIFNDDKTKTPSVPTLFNLNYENIFTISI